MSAIMKIVDDDAVAVNQRVAKRSIEVDEQMFIFVSICQANSAMRNEKLFRRRWDESYLRDLAVREKSFVAEYRLDPASFDVLSGMLEMDLQVNQKTSKVSTKSGAITTNSRLGAALIILAGGRRIESMRTHGLSQAFVYENLRKVVRAINNHPKLEIVCDTSLNSMKIKAKNYAELGDHNLFRYCVGAIDGLAIKTRTPSRNLFHNTARFISGSKTIVCINMQAECQSDLQFQAVTFKHAGCTNDAVAFETSSLKGLCKSLPFPYHWLGDNAYTLNETMLVPFPGQNLHITHPELETFNFYQSQMRITIECTFGVFVRRWGILWKSMEYNLDFQFEIIHACCRLHNFCIQRRLPTFQINGICYPIIDIDSNGVLTDPSWRKDTTPDLSISARTGSTLRNKIVNEIKSRQITKIRSQNLH